MIVVLDSSVWISAFQFGGVPLKVLDLSSGNSTVAICPEILNEVRTILTSKFNWPRANIDEAYAGYAQDMVVVQIRRNFHGVCRDPNDDMVIECAVQARASLIISGDKDLLAVERYQGIRILTARAFLEEVS